MPDNYITFRNNLLEYLNIEKVYDFIGQTNHTEGKKCDFIIHRRKLPVVEDIVGNLITASHDWPYRIFFLIREPLYVKIILDRTDTIKKGMFSIFNDLTDSYGAIRDSKDKTLQIRVDEAPDEITGARFSTLKMVITNLAKLNGYQVICPSTTSCRNLTKVFITHKSNSKIPDGSKRLICSIVNTKNKENTAITYTNYETFIETALKTTGGDFSMSEEMVRDLIKPVICYQLLTIKHDKAVVLNISEIENRVFYSPVLYVLYNYTRLDAIITQFDRKVADKIYPQLPSQHEVDFDYLSEQKEWELMINFILPFPSIIRKSVLNIQNGSVDVHSVLNFMFSFSRSVSSYYKATKILLDPLPNLLPYVYARIYLVKALIRVLSTGLSAAFGIESLENMIF